MSWTDGINTLCINYKEPRAQFCNKELNLIKKGGGIDNI